MAKKTIQIALPDGRILGYARFGDPDGAPVIFAHGFPASRLEAELWDAAASRRACRWSLPIALASGFPTSRRIV